MPQITKISKEAIIKTTYNIVRKEVEALIKLEKFKGGK